jgi:hypothetical protein
MSTDDGVSTGGGAPWRLPGWASSRSAARRRVNLLRAAAGLRLAPVRRDEPDDFHYVAENEAAAIMPRRGASNEIGTGPMDGRTAVAVILGSPRGDVQRAVVLANYANLVIDAGLTSPLGTLVEQYSTEGSQARVYIMTPGRFTADNQLVPENERVVGQLMTNISARVPIESVFVHPYPQEVTTLMVRLPESCAEEVGVQIRPEQYADLWLRHEDLPRPMAMAGHAVGAEGGAVAGHAGGAAVAAAARAADFRHAAAGSAAAVALAAHDRAAAVADPASAASIAGVPAARPAERPARSPAASSGSGTRRKLPVVRRHRGDRGLGRRG